MFSFWTSTPSPTVIWAGAKFQTAFIPPSISRSHAFCAACAGVVITPILMPFSRQYCGRPESGRTGFPLTSWASDADMQAEISELTSLLNEYVAQSVAEFVTGGRDINDDAQWNSYVDELRAMGMDRLVELTQQVNFGK